MNEMIVVAIDKYKFSFVEYDLINVSIVIAADNNKYCNNSNYIDYIETNYYYENDYLDNEYISVLASYVNKVNARIYDYIYHVVAFSLNSISYPIYRQKKKTKNKHTDHSLYMFFSVETTNTCVYRISMNIKRKKKRHSRHSRVCILEHSNFIYNIVIK